MYDQLRAGRLAFDTDGSTLPKQCKVLCKTSVNLYVLYFNQELEDFGDQEQGTGTNGRGNCDHVKY